MKRFSYSPIFNILKNETCLRISIDLVDNGIDDEALIYNKMRADRSLFRDFDCRECRKSTGENDSPFKITRHVEKHLAIENLDRYEFQMNLYRPAFDLEN